jgi:hypothetical protein
MSCIVRHRSVGTDFTRRTSCMIVSSIALFLGLLAVADGTTVPRLQAQESPPARVAPPPTPAARALPAAPAPVPEPVPTVSAPAAPPTVAAPTRQVFFAPAPSQPARRFQFTFAPDAALKDLLPAPPVRKTASGFEPSRTLVDVPEIDFQALPAKGLASEVATKQTAHMIAKVNHLNSKNNEGFMDALRGDRHDLAGLPFLMGNACRTNGDRSKELTRAVATVRNSLRGRSPQMVTGAFAAPSATRAFSGTLVLAASPAAEAPAAPSQPAEPAPQATPPAPTPATPPQAAVPMAVQPVDTLVTGFTMTSAAVAERASPTEFWDQYTAACAQEDKQVPTADRAHQETIVVARIAALMQVLSPQTPSMRVGLVKYLAAISHLEATRALARLAVFSEEDEVRSAAVAALQVRRERDYTDVLLGSLRYPWPAVAQRGADALAKLKRTDVVPQLVAMLDEPDPRAPVLKTTDGRPVNEARELVRINHHRNCLLCHAPGNTAGVSPETLTAAVPVPSDPLPNPADGYQSTSPDLSVRIDVTYLRPDFSVMQAVADANPWPEMQRYDFLVRTRTLTADEVTAAREKLATRDPGSPSPYQRATLAALRELTGRDTGPTADAWRRMLSLPAPERQAVLAPQ